jgi:hypothetical protein
MTAAPNDETAMWWIALYGTFLSGIFLGILVTALMAAAKRDDELSRRDDDYFRSKRHE